MNNECKILYRYFLGLGGKINKIPFREKKHRTKLFDDIQKVFPGYMKGYSSIYGNPHGSDDAVFKVIGTFKNNRVGWFRRLWMKSTKSY